jgi:poly-gamma-glutamate capsule biosynthesis protein CapA/YwtB (metallophosphatase superfamily)
MRIFTATLRGALVIALLLLSGCNQAPQVAITFGGDVMLSRDGAPLFSHIDPWSEIKTSIAAQQSGAQQSFFFANLESPVYDPAATVLGQKPQGYDLCADQDQLSVLRQGGIDLVNLANNHSLDCGTSAAAAESQLLAQSGFNTVGAGLTPTYLETQAGKIGVLGGEDVSTPLDENALLAAVRQARQQCDILVVSLHWGNEYQAGATDRQSDLAQKLTDAGVDIIWGTHPHVLQPMQWLHSSDGKHSTLVMYSLGNLLADQYMTSAAQQTALVTVVFRTGQIISVSVLPLTMDRSRKQLGLASGEVANLIEDQLGVSKLAKQGINLLLPAQ